ncbi:MAG: hypothetical protein ACXAEN_19810 [Candidatus Thorarchaeota archaeon]|jgi:hypothetical protein
MTLTPEAALARKQALLYMARVKDDAESFASFYELVFNECIPAHAIREWIEPLYEAREEGKGVVIEAFRGSTKTTTLTIAFTAWRIGKEPDKANLLIQVGDDTASDNTQQIADIIENNPGFKSVFPDVIPDRDRGWGAAGYEVKRNDIPYEQWREMNANRKDPSLLGVSYKSRAIIGRHPDGVLIVDDIHDENNTSSERELATVRKILTGTIFPTITKDTWKVFVGTPWVENDALQYVASTGEFKRVTTPVYRENGKGVEYTWPAKFDKKEVEKQKNLAGSIEFARMFMLDLTASQNKIYKYQLYPASEIRFTWPIVAGVDYAGTMDPAKNKTGKNDYFAIAYVAKLPGGGAVVVDGVLAHCTQAEAEGYVVSGQNSYPNYLVAVVEGDGKGEEFIQVARRNPGIKMRPEKTGGKSKSNRLITQMSPWLESGMVRISDAETPFLSELRKELDMPESARYDDARDALYWALRGMPDVLMIPKDEDELPATEKKKKTGNPVYAVDWSRV